MGCMGDQRDEAESGNAAIGAMAPEDDFGFVHLVAGGIRWLEAGGVADGTVGVDYAAARPADEVVVIVVCSRLEPSRRTGRLNSTKQAVFDEGVESVVHGLMRDRAPPRIHV